ncbi:hypothetical protein D9M69_539070 [compost metagenome]
MPATCMAAARAMRLAVPSTRVSKVSPELSRFLKPAAAGSSPGPATSRGTSVSAMMAIGATRTGVSRGASANSMVTGWPYIFSAMAAILPAYWARIQSSLKRLATNTVMRERSSATCAVRGLIQVLNCCSDSSCASWSTQACHRLSPMPSVDMGA